MSCHTGASVILTPDRESTHNVGGDPPMQQLLSAQGDALLNPPPACPTPATASAKGADAAGAKEEKLTVQQAMHKGAAWEVGLPYQPVLFGAEHERHIKITVGVSAPSVAKLQEYAQNPQREFSHINPLLIPIPSELVQHRLAVADREHTNGVLQGSAALAAYAADLAPAIAKQAEDALKREQHAVHHLEHDVQKEYKKEHKKGYRLDLEKGAYHERAFLNHVEVLTYSSAGLDTTMNVVLASAHRIDHDEWEESCAFVAPVRELNTGHSTAAELREWEKDDERRLRLAHSRYATDPHVTHGEKASDLDRVATYAQKAPFRRERYSYSRTPHNTKLTLWLNDSRMRVPRAVPNARTQEEAEKAGLGTYVYPGSRIVRPSMYFLSSPSQHHAVMSDMMNFGQILRGCQSTLTPILESQRMLFCNQTYRRMADVKGQCRHDKLGDQVSIDPSLELQYFMEEDFFRRHSSSWEYKAGRSYRDLWIPLNEHDKAATSPLAYIAVRYFTSLFEEDCRVRMREAFKQRQENLQAEMKKATDEGKQAVLVTVAGAEPTDEAMTKFFHEEVKRCMRGCADPDQAPCKGWSGFWVPRAQMVHRMLTLQRTIRHRDNVVDLHNMYLMIYPSLSQSQLTGAAAAGGGLAWKPRPVNLAVELCLHAFRVPVVPNHNPLFNPPTKVVAAAAAAAAAAEKKGRD